MRCSQRKAQTQEGESLSMAHEKSALLLHVQGCLTKYWLATQNEVFRIGSVTHVPQRRSYLYLQGSHPKKSEL